MDEQWSEATRMRWFYGTLAVLAGLVFLLFWPFLDVIAFSGVVAAVAHPLHERVTRLFRGQRLVAAIVVATGLLIAVFLPLGMLIYRFAMDGLQLARSVLADMSTEQGANYVQATWREDLSLFVADLGSWVPGGLDLDENILGPLQAGITQMLQSFTVAVPGLLGTFTSLVIDALLFVFSVIVLLADGPRLWEFIRDLSPLDDRYEVRLVDVFTEFATNAVIGVFGNAVAMGLVAGVGFALFGVPRPMFFAVLTGFAALIPIVGTGLVSVPVTLWMFMEHGAWTAAGLAAYALFVTGTTDNLLRPVFMRGSSQIHPLLIFFGVFGGMSWLGLTGVLLGPVLVACFLAMAEMRRLELVESGKNGA